MTEPGQVALPRWGWEGTVAGGADPVRPPGAVMDFVFLDFSSRGRGLPSSAPSLQGNHKVHRQVKALRSPAGQKRLLFSSASPSIPSSSLTLNSYKTRERPCLWNSLGVIMMGSR